MPRATAAAAALAIAACGILASSAPATGQPPLLTAPGVSPVVPAADAPVADLAAGVTSLGHRLTMGADPATNMVSSPVSIATAFAMARAGAGGETAAELDRVFGFPATGLHEACNAFGRSIGGGPVRVANAVFADRRLRVGEPFLKTLTQQYAAGVRAVDFRSPAANDVVNAWVRQHTAERIKKLFDRLDPNTQLVLANAVHFKADWATPFLAETTRPEKFTRADGSTVQVPTMTSDGQLRYAAGPGWQAVELPYKNGDYAMWVLVPAPGGSPDALLAPAVMTTVGTSLAPARVGLALPKWDFGSDLDLRRELGRLGLNAPFGPTADFAGISPGLYIDQAVHRANITVDEKGTEAAAVTGLAMAVSAPVLDVEVRADRPFAFAVMHLPTRTPLFVGRVANPTG